MFVCIAAVLILRPMTKQLGRFLEAATKERMEPARPVAARDSDSARMLALMEHMVKRIDAMEDRLDFTERLVSAGQSRAQQRSVQDRSDVGLLEEALHTAHR
jgi:hypothetical protein